MYWEQTALHVQCIDKFAPFHNRMSVIHNIFVKLQQTIPFCEAESARKISATKKLRDIVWYPFLFKLVNRRYKNVTQ